MINTSRLTYRTAQFCRTLLVKAEAVEKEQIRPHLSPTQMVLFRRMQPSEQAHANLVLRQLQGEDHNQPDLLTAALLHDVGKILYPLMVWERIAAVLGKMLVPRLVQRWGQGYLRGLRRPFVVSVHHADWGADLVAQTGASKRTVCLIRRHQEQLSTPSRSRDDRLLALLQKADNEN